MGNDLMHRTKCKCPFCKKIYYLGTTWSGPGIYYKYCKKHESLKTSEEYEDCSSNPIHTIRAGAI
jgi:hypothetical protein